MKALRKNPAGWSQKFKCSSPDQNFCNTGSEFTQPESELFPEQPEGVEDAEHCNSRVSENRGPDVS